MLLLVGGIRPRLRLFEIRLHLGSAARVPKCIELAILRDISPALGICVLCLYFLLYLSKACPDVLGWDYRIEVELTAHSYFLTAH